MSLYHCNYCQRNISDSVRIKCAICMDFDLCVECFSVGVELGEHKNTHSYRVMDFLAFPLHHPAWGADEELLLLEGIDMYGIGNWQAVSEHVGEKAPEVRYSVTRISVLFIVHTFAGLRLQTCTCRLVSSITIRYTSNHR